MDVAWVKTRALPIKYGKIMGTGIAAGSNDIYPSLIRTPRRDQTRRVIQTEFRN